MCEKFSNWKMCCHSKIVISKISKMYLNDSVVQSHDLLCMEKIQLSLEYCLLYRRLYIVSPNIPAVKIIADHINADLSTSAAKKYKILFVPRKVGVINALTKARSLFLCLSYRINIICW